MLNAWFYHYVTQHHFIFQRIWTVILQDDRNLCLQEILIFIAKVYLSDELFSC